MRMMNSFKAYWILWLREMLKTIDNAYLNQKKEFYNPDFANLTSIVDGTINYPKRTPFLDEETKNRLKQDILNHYENACFIIEYNGIYSLIANFDLKGNIKKHEFVIPDVVQGMVLNYQHYNAEAAPISVLAGSRVDFESILNSIAYDTLVHYDQAQVYVFKDDKAESILDKVDMNQEYYLADGHHRYLASQHIINKEGCLAMISNLDDVRIDAINRKMQLVESFQDSIDYLDQEGFVRVQGPLRKGLVEIQYQGKSYFYEFQNMENDIFGNHDIYRLHTQIISQGFKQYDSMSLTYSSSAMTLNDNEVAFKTWPMSKGEFQRYADKDIILPPKSTSFEPKCPSLFVIAMIQ